MSPIAPLQDVLMAASANSKSNQSYCITDRNIIILLGISFQFCSRKRSFCIDQG